MQLFFEINTEQNTAPFTEVLLWNMFKEQNISFTQVQFQLDDCLLSLFSILSNGGWVSGERNLQQF